jgi:transposase
MMEVETGERHLPLLAKETIAELYERMLKLDSKAAEYERKIAGLAGQSEAARRLMKIEGIGPITATAVVASVGGWQAVSQRKRVCCLARADAKTAFERR